MRILFFLLLVVGLSYGQTRQEILNNLQRRDAVDIVDTSPDSTYKFLIWDDVGLEVKLGVAQRVGATVFDTLTANVFNMTDAFSASADITLENGEILDNGTDAIINFFYNDSAAALAEFNVSSSLDTPDVKDDMYMLLNFEFNDDSSGLTDYGQIKATATDVTDESEDSKIEFKTFYGGTQMTPLALDGKSVSVDSGAVAGIGTFTGTAEHDTVLISGALATDLYFLTGRGSTVDQQDVLQAEAKADTLIVHRLASGQSGLTYNWLRVKYH